MHDNQSTFDALGTLFERYVRNLKACHKPEQRADMLVGMVVLIKEIDRLIANEYSSLADTARETRPLFPQSDKPVNIRTHQSQPAVWQIVVLRQKGGGK